MLKISYASCFGLSSTIFAQFTLKCWSQPEITKNSRKPPILGVHGHSRSSMLTFLRSSSPILVMISSMSAPICNHFDVRRANNDKITPFKGRGCPSFSPSFVGIPLTQVRKILARNTKDSIGYHMVKTEVSISPGLRMVPGRDTKTDRQTELP